MAAKIRVFIVDDSALVRQTLSDVLSSDPGIEVVGIAQDPIIAMSKLSQDMPDVIVLDVEMPRMDGITFLQKLMSTTPIPVVICSSKTEFGSDNALRAMEFGAIEIINKPKLGTKVFLEESKIRICDAIKAASLARIRKLPGTSMYDIPPKLNADAMLAKPKNAILQTTEKIVAVGASTGGTEAIRIFLQALPPASPGVVIVQHMPQEFTSAFARRLDTMCEVTVKEAENNDTIVPGCALIAPGNFHTLIMRSGARYFIEIKDGPLVSRHRPSVDVLFRSAAKYAGKNAIGVIMTGMGDDGAKGMKEMKDAGAFTIAQDERTSVVFGMPAEAIKLGGVDKVMPLEAIAHEVMKRIS
jgi:two-component system chemotaxis response regulator CheB